MLINQLLQLYHNRYGEESSLKTTFWLVRDGATKKLSLPSENKVFFPRNYHSLWVLVAVDIESQKLIVYDSLSTIVEVETSFQEEPNNSSGTWIKTQNTGHSPKT